jgi:hypothetical protein
MHVPCATHRTTVLPSSRSRLLERNGRVVVVLFETVDVHRAATTPTDLRRRANASGVTPRASRLRTLRREAVLSHFQVAGAGRVRRLSTTTTRSMAVTLVLVRRRMLERGDPAVRWPIPGVSVTVTAAAWEAALTRVQHQRVATYRLSLSASRMNGAAAAMTPPAVTAPAKVAILSSRIKAVAAHQAMAALAVGASPVSTVVAVPRHHSVNNSVQAPARQVACAIAEAPVSLMEEAAAFLPAEMVVHPAAAARTVSARTA